MIRNRSLFRRRSVVAGLGCALLAFAAGLPGCVISGNTVRGNAKLTTEHLAAMPVWVETDNGSVRVTGDRSLAEVVIDADIRAQTQERLELVTISSERQPDGALKIWAEWPEGKRLSNEGVSFVIALPEASGVKVRTSNGSIYVGQLGGNADLKTSNGRIEAISQGGAVDAASSNGSIVVKDPGGEVSAKSSNGRVTISGAPAGVTVKTSNGSIESTLAEGCAGPVDLVTSNGRVSLVVGGMFRGELEVSTSNGRIGVPAEGKGGQRVVVSKSKNRASVTFGEATDAAKSRIATSNGSVEVDVR